MAEEHIKILVVEDDFQNRQLINIYLSRSHYDVTLAVNGFDALEKLKQFTPDLIVSDISMPNMDGFELYDQVKKLEHLRSIPFIFLTAHSDIEKRRHSKEIGSDDFLTKPIEQEDLLVSIRGKLKRVQEIRSSAHHQAMNEVDHLKREILSTITHEVNTPLFIIKLTTNLLLDDSMEFKPTELQELLMRIQRSGERLDGLLKDFLISARIAAGDAIKEFKEAKQEVDVSYILRHLLPKLEKMASAVGIRLTADLGTPLPPVEIHVDQFADVIERLVHNAVKFNKPQGTVHIRCEQDDEDVFIRIKDTGIGIPADKISYIFEKFYQVNRSEMEQQGAGLGLPIARDLAYINRGDLTVRSSEGEGSEFTLRLPIN
jgi:signal transduction histidine kinase